ncbi:Probable serine/threonine-protein kinase PknB [Durusdinium trenchii]|uniref:Probable serine/threonine-protein kinase PknB n=1 Tax=Durusdinium trenchii TaxID=1381693 RepID=A0ABP0IWC4_9DINO
MGVVFEAIDTNLNRTVAIKMLRRFLAASGVSRRRFIREARASAAIRHPNVITVYSTHDDGDLPFLVMEYIQGPTLQDHIVEHGRLDPIDVVRMARDIAYGLAAAHRQGVVHRDIKPSNILLESDLSGLKISDFGLARASFDKGQLTSHEIALGTPAYMSPEQITCSDHLDARSDLFSLGCVIYAMVTGHSPFQGRSALDIARRVASEVPQALTAVVPTTPRFLSDLTTKLLARDPELRFQTADEVGDVLDRFLAQINQTPSSQLSEVLATPLDISVAPSAPSPRRSRRGWWKGALGGVALLTLLWLTYDQWPRPEDAPPEVVDQGDSAPLVPNNGADVARLERVTVSREGGDCTTVAAALDLVRQGGTIHVQGPLVLSEPLFVGGGDHHRNLRLVGDDGVVFQHSGDGPLVTVSGTPGVTISGFRFEAHARQHAVLIVGDCPGLLIEDATFQAPAESPFALLYFTSAAKGAADAPMTVRNCHIQARPESIDLRVINNTYVGCHHWLSLHESPPDRPGVMIHNNLLIDVGPCKSANVPPSQYAGGAWDFACNFWKAPEAFSRISVVETGRAATFVESIEFEEWDLEAGCVRIAADSPLAQAGRIGETPTYVGANLNMRR